MSESILYTAVATDSSSSLTDETTAVLELPAMENTTDSRRLCPSDNNTSVQYRMIRKWQVFPGRNRFCCNGRIVMAKDAGVFYLTIFLIITTSGLFFGFDCPYLADALSPAIPIIDGLLFVFVMCTLLRTSFTDPGILPRATTDEASYIEQQIEMVGNVDDTPSYRPPPRTQDINIRGHTTKTKYCFTCKIFRPPRASHCSVCDNCVERFDHHCPWVGNCVGQRNYRYFYMFLVSLSLHAIVLFICSIAHLILIARTSDFITAIQHSPASVVVVAVCFFSVWSVIGLAGFHTYLTVSSQTTNEDIKGTFSHRYGSQTFNPFSHGSMCLNFCANVCGPVYPSVIDRRGYIRSDVDEHKLNTVQHDRYGTTDTNVVLPVTQTSDELSRVVDVQREDISTVSATNS